MARKVVYILSILICAAVAVLTTHPASPAPAILTPTTAPSAATPSLPPCENEDGSGQMLCMWDASESGNGEGIDAIGGDCSIATVGSKAASDLCVRLYGKAATHTVNADGSVVDIPNGVALVSECNDIAFEASIDADMATYLANDGWTIEICFEAML